MSIASLVQPPQVITTRLGIPRRTQWLAQVWDPMLPGAFPGAVDDFPGGDGWNTAMTGIAPSAWVYLALHGPGLLRGL